MPKLRSKAIKWALVGAVTTAVAVLIILNLSSGEKKIERGIQPLYGVSDPQFERSMGSLLGPRIVGGNRVTGLVNGDQVFPAMLAAIRSAQKTITFETYIYWSGTVGSEFSQALSDRARAGVKVHLLLDWVGSGKMDKELLNQMVRAGVEVEWYHPLKWYTLSRLNHRTHRKLLVVDGKVGFTGGIGIADHWLGNAQDPEHWRDSHFRIEGPAVAQMQAAFLDNWIKTRSVVLHSEDYFPPLDSTGPHKAQVFKSSLREGSESVRLMYLLSIASARKNIRLSNSYFVPDSLAVATIVDARKRGVSVEIILPGPHLDAQVVRKASRSRWGPLLESGVEIYEFMPTMYHCKVMIVDDVWVSVGSTNFDNRSFRLNDEANLNVYDPGFAAEATKVFELDKRRSQRVTLAMWENRPWPERFKEWAAGLLRSQL